MFKVNDKVVYPVYGVGIITEKKKEKIGDKNVEFFNISFLHSDMEVMVPVDKMETNFVRLISSESKLKKSLKILRDEPIKPTDEDVKQILMDVSEIIKNSDLLETAKWMSKLICRRRNHGQLNANEKKLYLTFKSLITGELSLIKNIDYEQAEKYLDKTIRKNLKLSEEELEFLGLNEEI